MSKELMNTMSGLVKQMNLQELIELDNTVRRALKSQHNWFNAERPGWDAYGCFLAYAASLRGSCVRRKVGAVVMDVDNNVLSTGYNGKGSGLTNCADDPCAGANGAPGTALDACEAIHAETNAIMRVTDRSKIHTLYATCSPCVHCVDTLLGTPCKRIVFSEEYSHNEESKRRWLKAGREWVHYKGPSNWTEINEPPALFPPISTQHSSIGQLKSEMVCKGGCGCANPTKQNTLSA